MKIVLKRTLCVDDIGEQRCAICRRDFYLGPATAFAISDDGLVLGEVCPRCLEGGVEKMQAELDSNAHISRAQAIEDQRYADEGFAGEAPSLAEYKMLERVFRTPLYKSPEDADRALVNGGPGFLDDDDY